MLMLCSCNAVSLSGTEQLLTAPKLNKRQAQLSQALESTLSLPGIIYKYPREGEYRSPFVFFDFDGNSREEAIVFYSSANDSDNRVRAKILTEASAGAWSPVADISLQSSQVEFVQFEKLLDEQSYCVLIGCQGAGQNLSTLEIYSLRDNKFQLEASLDYRNFAVRDFDGDGIAEVVMVSRDKSVERYYVSLLRSKGGRIEPVSSVDLASDMDFTLKLTCGSLWDGGSAVYIDEILGDGPSPTTATEIIRVSKSGLSLLSGGEPVLADEPESFARNNYEITFRDGEILCMDVDGDGIVEVPYPVSLPGSAFDTGAAAPKLIQLMHLTAEGFDVKRSAVINYDAGYLVYFPERWIDNVTIEMERESSEWHFRKWDSNMMEPAEELLRIRVSSTNDNLTDVFEDYIDLASRGTAAYTAYIPRLPGESLAVTAQDVEAMFLLLPS